MKTIRVYNNKFNEILNLTAIQYYLVMVLYKTEMDFEYEEIPYNGGDLETIETLYSKIYCNYFKNEIIFKIAFSKYINSAKTL